MCEKLNHAGDGVCAIDSTLRATQDFDLVDVLRGESGKIDGAAGWIDGRAVDENLSKAGVAAIEKDGGASALWTRAANGNARRELQQIGNRNGLALLDFLAADEIDGRGCLVDFEGLGVCGDDHVFRELLDFEAEVERAVFTGSQVQNKIAGDERCALEMKVVAAVWND